MATKLGDKINLLRKERGLTLDQLAEKTDSSKGYIWELENRETKKPSAEKLQKIADALSTTTEFLLDEKKKKPDETVIEQAFFRKFRQMDEEDQKKLMQIADAWSDKK